ncbi:MAG: hypothetical protein FD164_1677 [Nitrospirae bacterium]|nr:MAG: hypothetical protein FD164_1677 [Nitrospirota bacterium]
MRKLLIVCVVLVFGLMLGCASTQTADTKAAPAYKFIVMPGKSIDVPVAGGQKVTFNTGEVLKNALMNEYKGQASVVDGQPQAGAIVVEPRVAEIWKRGPIVKEGVAAGYVNSKWVAGYYGEFDGDVDAKDAKIKVEGAAAEFAKKVRAEIAP